LSLQRGCNRRGHRVGARARKMPGDDDRRKVDGRDRSHGKQAIAEQAKNDESQHQQRRHHRTTNAELRQAHDASPFGASLTIWTRVPSLRRSWPSVTTFSPALRPLAMTAAPSTVRATVTGLISAVL